MRIHGHAVEDTDGLLRFELALKRTFMRKNKFIKEKYINVSSTGKKVIKAEASDPAEKLRGKSWDSYPSGNGWYSMLRTLAKIVDVTKDCDELF